MGVAANRKVTHVANTLSNLAAQSKYVGNADMTQFFAAANEVMTPYNTPPISQRISEVWLDPSTTPPTPRVMWSKSSTGSNLTPRGTGTSVNVPTALAVPGTYLIYSEVNFRYDVPASIGYVAHSTMNLGDVSYARPRYSLSVPFCTNVPSPPDPPTGCTTF
jgi:Flp pilus assembly protein TadG